MFGIGMPELLLILAIALIVFGPKKLPELAKSLGKALNEFKSATNDLKETISKETGLDEVRESLQETRRDLQRSLDDVPPASPAAAAGLEIPEGAKGPASGEPAGSPPEKTQSAGESGKPEDAPLR